MGQLYSADQTLRSKRSTPTSPKGQMETITVALPNVSVTSVYKPPQSPFLHPELPDRCKRKYHISIGDFNAHSTWWGYEKNNQDGDEVEIWLESKHLTLIQDAKLPKSFHSARWKRGYKPDLVCVSSELTSRVVKEVLDPIPHTQHRPITITIRSVLQATTVPFGRRFNLRKADWLSFQREIENSISSIPSHPNNYSMFIDLLKRSARRHIPRECQTEYISGLSETSSDLLKAYHGAYHEDPFSPTTMELGEIVLNKVGEDRRKAWKELLENTNMTNNSRKAWATIRRLGEDHTTPPTLTTVTANSVAAQLVANGRSQNRRKPTGEYRRTAVPDHPQPARALTKPFDPQELEAAMSMLKPGKAAGIDDVLAEMIQHLGPKAKTWLLEMLNSCMAEKVIPPVWRKAKTVAILKPGKDPSSPKSYRPISLLCITYKLYERLLLQRLMPLIDPKLTKDQAGFRPGRSCTGQLLNLTQHIEDGFECKLITGAAFIDLTAAYDTVQDRTMIRKLFDMTGDLDLCQIIKSILNNRRFFVQLNDKKSKWKAQKNGLPQGSVLAPLLFNIYTNDQPLHPQCRRFIYADDLCITTQQENFQKIEPVLESALLEMTTYYNNNHLKPNPSKTQLCSFHLKNRDAKNELSISWDGYKLSNHPHPVYLGVTLDRTLSFKTHLQNTKAKINTHNNILRKLVNSKWGADPPTISVTALALCFSTAEYACSSWSRSHHTKLIDTALNDTCRIITGCIKTTPVPCLYALSGIAPPPHQTIHHRPRRAESTGV
ncbi:putative RNA-directed DNA polymerase from transposon X-element [Siphateles boraxobius]|uniref:putative RNA-directed DNA polymerase from transposon X-element n=1 Tax=Siphateles boraxobius TaxID=180520 RepID=UPI0040636738